MKYGGETYKGIWPRKRAKIPARKLARKQERRVAKLQCKDK